MYPKSLRTLIASFTVFHLAGMTNQVFDTLGEKMTNSPILVVYNFLGGDFRVTNDRLEVNNTDNTVYKQNFHYQLFSTTNNLKPVTT